MENTNVNTIMEVDNVSSICIPRVFDNIGQDRIQQVFIKLNIFLIERVDVVQKQNEKGEKFKRVFVHIKEWLQHSDALKAKERLLAGKELKIVYDDPWFWKVAVNKWTVTPKPVPVPIQKPKIRIDYEDTDETRDLKPREKKYDNRRPYKERCNDQPHRKPADDNRPRPMEPKRNKYDRNNREKHYKKVPEVKQEKEEIMDAIVEVKQDNVEVKQEKEDIVEAIVEEIVEEIVEDNCVRRRVDLTKYFNNTAVVSKTLISEYDGAGTFVEEAEEEETISVIKKSKANRSPEQKDMERRSNALLAKLCS